MAIAVYVNDVLFFGPDEAAMEAVISDLQSENFQLKCKKAGDDPVYIFLGLQISEHDGGLVIILSDTLSLDCYVDADFAGLWSYEDDQDHVCVKSRTGYVMTLGGSPVHWASKLQTLISLSTVESEYIALATIMHDLLSMKHALVITSICMCFKRLSEIWI